MRRFQFGFGFSAGLSVFTGPLSAALFGDSITAVNTVNISDAATYRNSGYFTAYNALSLERMPLPPANNLGVGGEGVETMLARVDDLDPLDFDVCFFMGGTNDIASDRTAAQITGPSDDIVDHITGLGKTVVWLTILPRTHSGNAAARKQAIKDVNTHILAAHGSRGGKVISIDLYTSFADGSDEPLANLTYDGLHPTPYGAMVMAQDIYDALLPVYGTGQIPDFSTGNLLTNGIMAGTGGTVYFGLGGVCADSWTLESFGDFLGAKSGGHQVISCDFTAGHTDNGWNLDQTISTGYANGDILKGYALVEIEDVSNIDQLYFQISKNGSYGADGIAQVQGFQESGMLIAENFVNPGEYLITTPEMIVNDTANFPSIRTRIHLQVKDSSQSTTSSVTIKAMGLFKV